jgi:hypothetical protein
MRRRFGVLVLGLAAALTGPDVPAGQVTERPPTPLPPLMMTDQFERTVPLSDLRGRIVVVVYGDKKSADASKALGEWLHVAFHPSAAGQSPGRARQAPVKPVDGLPPGTPAPDVVVIPAAAIGSVPGPVAGWIRRQFRDASPEVPVWLDFDDRLKQLFGLVAGEPNLVVIDAAGRLRHAATGTLLPDQRNQLLAAIEVLRREAVTSPR